MKYENTTVKQKIMKLILDIQTLENCKVRDWDFGNKILYDLCANNFSHHEIDKIIAKIWLIGRAYSVAIERTKSKKTINDNFYIDNVAPKIKGSKIDSRLEELKKIDSLSIDNLEKVLETHFYLKSEIHKITLLNNRSFCSKYLHFHLPNLFFIYDSRVVESLRKFKIKLPINEFGKIFTSNSIDKEYATFVCKCYVLRQEISDAYGINLTIRQFDNILIDIANKILTEKRISN